MEQSLNSCCCESLVSCSHLFAANCPFSCLLFLPRFFLDKWQNPCQVFRACIDKFVRYSKSSSIFLACGLGLCELAGWQRKPDCNEIMTNLIIYYVYLCIKYYICVYCYVASPQSQASLCGRAVTSKNRG